MRRDLASRWLGVAIWIAVIYTAIPFVRNLREAFVARWPGEVLAFAVMGIVAAAAAGAVLSLRHLQGRIHFPDVAWLAGCALVLIVWTRKLMGQPEEAVHFLEYGILGVLLYRALRPSMDNNGVFIACALVGTTVGTVDELIQWVVPGRFWDFRDLVLNGGASILTQIAVWRLVSRPSRGLTPQTIRVLCRLAAIQVLILMLCLAGTPQRLGVLATTLPALKSLADSGDVLCEYGYLHRLDGTTLFRSRLSRIDIANEDRLRSQESAAALDRAGGRYQDFLNTVTPRGDPFTYEARVHIFARNRSLAEARRYAVGTREHRRSMTEATRENTILERVFGETLNRSRFRWPKDLRTTVEAAQDPGARYVSKVAGHLITRLSEAMLRTLMLGILVALIAADMILGRRIKPQQHPAEPE